MIGITSNRKCSSSSILFLHEKIVLVDWQGVGYIFQFQFVIGGYRIVGKFGEFGEYTWFAKLKPSKLVLTINNVLAYLLIRQTFFRQRLKQS